MNKIFTLSISSMLLLSLNLNADMIDYYMMGILPSLSSLNNYTYGTITSTETGKVWLDRNLGAREVCSKSRDSFANNTDYITSQQRCFGYYYQWGRPTDGHQKVNSSTTYTIATSINPAHSNFILSDYLHNGKWTTADPNATQRQSSWNPCPSGYRIPSLNELQAENISNRSDAFNKLKIPDAGTRSYYDGDIDSKGVNAYLWSLTLGGSSSSQAGALYIENSSAYIGFLNAHADGLSVRCIEQ